MVIQLYYERGFDYRVCLVIHEAKDVVLVAVNHGVKNMSEVSLQLKVHCRGYKTVRPSLMLHADSLNS